MFFFNKKNCTSVTTMAQDPVLEGLSNLMAPSSPSPEDPGSLTNPTSLKKVIDEVVLQALPAFVMAGAKSAPSKSKASPTSCSSSSLASEISPPSLPRKRQHRTKHLARHKSKHKSKPLKNVGPDTSPFHLLHHPHPLTPS